MVEKRTKVLLIILGVVAVIGIGVFIWVRNSMTGSASILGGSSGDIVGEVTDKDTKEKIIGAKVQAYLEGNLWKEKDTDSRGKYTLSGAKSKTTYRMKFNADGQNYLPDEIDKKTGTFGPWDSQSSQNAVLAKAKTGRIGGKVTIGGKPVKVSGAEAMVVFQFLRVPPWSDKKVGDKVTGRIIASGTPGQADYKTTYETSLLEGTYAATVYVSTNSAKKATVSFAIVKDEMRPKDLSF